MAQVVIINTFSYTPLSIYHINLPTYLDELGIVGNYLLYQPDTTNKNPYIIFRPKPIEVI